MVGAISWAATSGTVIPQVSTSVVAWGGTGPVGVTSEVMNDSRVAIEVVDGARPRPGLKLMGYTTEPNASSEFAPTESPSDPFPLRLEPDQSVDLTAWYRVTDCQAVEDIDPGDGEIELQVRIADGPAAVHRRAHDRRQGRGAHRLPADVVARRRCVPRLRRLTVATSDRRRSTTERWNAAHHQSVIAW